jgi:hypothetical protein
MTGDNKAQNEDIETIEAEPVDDDEAASRPTGPDTNAKSSGGGRRFILWSLVIAAVIAGATVYAAWPLITARIAEQTAALLPHSGPLAGAVERLAERQAGIAQRLDTMERATMEFDQRIGEIGERVAALADALPTVGSATAEDTAALSQRLSQLEQQIAGLSRDFASASATATTAPTGDPAVAGLNARIESLSQELAAIKVQQDPGIIDSLRDQVATLTQTAAQLGRQRTAAEEQVETLKARLLAVETAAASSAATARQPAVLLAYVRLHDSVWSGRPYAAALDAFEQAAKALPTIEKRIGRLRATADTGVATRQALRDSFRPLADRIVRLKAPVGDSLVDRTLAKVSQLVVVRRTGDAEGDTPSAIVARAESRLAGNNLAAAVAELEKLSGDPGVAAKPWLADARARLEAEQSMAELRQDIANTMAGG